ncbi:nicotinic acetylcholine receptor alpha 5 subunit-like protein [Leptotrombidium deliense]|uniref:Nicotinic acetylcholine receptor alpha 5 subunit-like protein n=1 Tax=Leptotrombidium deliense TaxID=299467 RepID=A0A443SFB4_9ACAR|nr:nicotinic acetylcholine receptor alpha 5 subunit-like protein [Leptotrombidium deliense]
MIFIHSYPHFSADDYTRGYMQSRAMLSPDGKIFWPPPTKLRSTCPVDVTYFPFDDQTCIMKLGSWIYNGLQVDLYNRTSEVDLSNYVQNGEWDLLETQIIRNVVYFPCCPEPFPDVKIVLVIRRKTLYYMYNIVLPCMMMSVLTLLVFCLPPDSGEKVSLGVTVLLAFSVFMLAISEKLPETSESIPLLGIYLTAVMAITSISVIMTVIVLNFHYRGPIRKEMPEWLKNFLMEKMVENNAPYPRAFQVNSTWHTESASFPYAANPVPSMASSSIASHFIRSTTDANARANVDATTSFCQHEDYIEDESIRMRTFGDSLESLNVAFMNELKSMNNCYPASSKQTNNSNTGANASREKTSPQEEMLRILRYLLWRQELEDKHNKMVHEWRLLALAIDKVLFWVFLVITVTSSLSFLVIIPVQRRGFGFGFDAH